MATTDDIFRFVQTSGPVLPTHVMKEFRINSMFAGAFLAELVSNKKVLLSKIRVGQSPLYYIPGQENKLVEYIKFLEPKEKDAITLLQTEKILQDKTLDPLMRIALRNAKDFAVPLGVTTGENKEIFWKFFLTTDSEAEIIIKKKLNIDQETEEKKIEAPKQIVEQAKGKDDYDDLVKKYSLLKKQFDQFKKEAETNKVTEVKKPIEKIKGKEEQLKLTEQHKKLKIEKLAKF